MVSIVLRDSVANIYNKNIGVVMKKLKTLWFGLVCFLFCSIFYSPLAGIGRPVLQEESKKKSQLVQPDKWWKVHPRPIYSKLKKVGTFQSWFDVYELLPDTFAIYEPNQFEEAICYLVLGGKRGVLIDTGNGIGDLKSLVSKLTTLPVSVVLTHEHYDHVAGAHQFKEIAMFENADALKVLKAGRDNSSMQKYLTPDYLWKPLPKKFDPKKWEIPSMEPTSLFHEGDIIDLGGRKLEVIYTPGHSPGSVCLLDKKNRLLFTGDHFFPGPLYAHAPDVNLKDYIKSTKKLAARIKEYDYLLSGHNDPWIKSEVILRVEAAFNTILSGKGKFSEDRGLRRYYFKGFDILIRRDQIKQLDE
jgi:glyoxylase-like metal-dependent hydrolase (beta-lactamase superfamily II)